MAASRVLACGSGGVRGESLFSAPLTLPRQGCQGAILDAADLRARINEAEAPVEAAAPIVVGTHVKFNSKNAPRPGFPGQRLQQGAAGAAPPRSFLDPKILHQQNPPALEG